MFLFQVGLVVSVLAVVYCSCTTRLTIQVVELVDPHRLYIISNVRIYIADIVFLLMQFI